jgi:NAD(P)-dependent dehydrogenase (short-subunit alcohol dehydrogenase family)/SAM-dependent methyltransferase
VSRALVTGGTSGIGAATARLLLARGWQVAVLSRHVEGAPEGAVAVVADVADGAAVQRAVDEAARVLGGIDLLVNNAGTTAAGTLEQLGDDEWQRVIDVNVLGVVRVTRAALPHLRRSEAGAIVNVGSFLVETGLPQRSAYAASKGAVHALTRALAADLAPAGITVNAVAPGTVETPWIDRLLEGSPDPERQRAALVARQAIGRLVQPEEVAEAILHLASSRATTGTVLDVDGGASHLRLPSDPLRAQYATGRNLDARIAIHARFSTASQRWYPWLFERLGPLERARVLEVGCGTGLFWRANAGSVPPDASLTLTDASSGMVTEARAATARLPCSVDVLVADAQELPFADGSFDVVIANHMLYHVPDRPRALREFRRVLAPGGRLVAATNGDLHMAELRRLAGRFGADTTAWIGGSSHPFHLEDAPQELAAVFAEVEVERFESALRVTEVEPVVDYVASLSRHDAVDYEGMRREVAEAIERDGAFAVTCESGVLVARG